MPQNIPAVIFRTPRNVQLSREQRLFWPPQLSAVQNPTYLSVVSWPWGSCFILGNNMNWKVILSAATMISVAAVFIILIGINTGSVPGASSHVEVNTEINSPAATPTETSTVITDDPSRLVEWQDWFCIWKLLRICGESIFVLLQTSRCTLSNLCRHQWGGGIQVYLEATHDERTLVPRICWRIVSAG